MEILKIFFLPFLFFPVWGLFACFFVAMLVANKTIDKLGFVGSCIFSSVVILLIFYPFFVVSKGGNIPVIFPSIAVFVGYLFQSYLDYPIGRAEFVNPYIVVPGGAVISFLATFVAQRRSLKSV